MRYGWLILGGHWAAAALGVWICAHGPIRAGTKEGADMLNVLFGEARMAISLSLFDRADVYFHGGVGHVDCARGLSRTAEEYDHAHDRADDHGEAHGHAADHDAHAHGDDALPTLADLHGDLWSYLNTRVHPRGHRHLAGVAEEREVLPWLWAAARVDPHNILAYQVGAYWLVCRLRNIDEGLRFIGDGIRNNPESADLEFCRGEILLAASKDVDGAAKAFLEARRKWQPGTTQEEKEDNQFMLGRALMYLADIHAKQGHLESARQYYLETLKVVPGHPLATQKLHALQSGGK